MTPSLPPGNDGKEEVEGARGWGRLLDMTAVSSGHDKG